MRALKELEDAYKTIQANKETVEAQLRELDALRRNIETLTILRDELEKKLAEKVAALHDELGADLLRRFTASNEHDFALYRFAQRRFTTLCEAAGIGG